MTTEQDNIKTTDKEEPQQLTLDKIIKNIRDIKKKYSNDDSNSGESKRTKNKPK